MNPYLLTGILVIVFSIGSWLGFQSGIDACTDFITQRAFEQRYEVQIAAFPVMKYEGEVLEIVNSTIR